MLGAAPRGLQTACVGAITNSHYALWLQALDFDDDYPTCRATYATFRVFGDSLIPAELTRLLQHQPSLAWRSGDVRPGRPVARTGGWLLSSEEHVMSHDVRRHLHWLRERLASRHAELHKLQHDGYSLDLFCYWVSAGGHGGPTVDPETMAWLSYVDVPLGFDVYFPPP